VLLLGRKLELLQDQLLLQLIASSVARHALISMLQICCSYTSN